MSVNTHATASLHDTAREKTICYYSGKWRVVLWFILFLVLAAMIWYYSMRGWTIGVIICSIWALLSFSWAINLLKNPIIEFKDDRVNILQRMVFGYPIYLTLNIKELTGVGRSTKTHLEIFSNQVSPCILNLKLLKKSDRQLFKQMLSELHPTKPTS